MNRLRRNTLRSVLLATGILMLALTVLPHHHHGKTICFSAQEQCPACEGTTPDEGHSHNERDENCDLKHLFVMSGRDDSLSGEYTALSSAGSPDASDLFFCCPFHTAVPEPATTESVRPEPSYLRIPASEDASRISALRAPPVFIV